MFAFCNDENDDDDDDDDVVILPEMHMVHAFNYSMCIKLDVYARSLTMYFITYAHIVHTPHHLHTLEHMHNLSYMNQWQHEMRVEF